MLVLGLNTLGCRPPAPRTPSAEARPVTTPTTSEPVVAAPTERPSSTVVARVADTPITLGELTAAHRRQPPSVSQSEVLLVLVERELMRRAAREQQVIVIDDEIDHVIKLVTESNGITTERLRSEVEAHAMSWAEYREELAAPVLELKLLRTLYPRVAETSAETSVGQANAFDRVRRSLLACLRADTPIEIDDPELTLPEEPLATSVTLEAFTLHGETGLPAEVLTAAAHAAAPAEVPLCRGLAAVEDAITAALGEAGFFAVTVVARWPDHVRPRMTIDLDVTAGALHRVGEIRFDQSEVPRSARIEVATLRRAVGAHLRRGQVVSTSTLAAAGQAVNESLGRRPLELLGVGTSLRVVGDEAHVDLTYYFFPRRGARR